MADSVMTAPTRTNILTLWEILRLWFAGREYREKRIPELVADIVSGAQDENALAGVLSNWFRNNFVDENHTALLFTAGRLLRARGGRFTAIAEALEAVPDISEEMRRRPEMQTTGTPEERQTLLKEAMATAVAERYEAIKNRLAATTTPTSEGGHVADTTNPTPPPGPSIWERLAAMFGGFSEGLGGAAKVAVGAAAVAFQFLAFWTGASVLYLMLAVLVAFTAPGWMHAFAWLSFAGLIGIPALAMVVSVVLGRVGALIQAAAGFLLTYFSSSLLVIVFALAAVCTIITGNEPFAVLLMGQIIVVVWDRVVIGLTQKLLGTPGFFTKVLAAVANDGRIDASEAAGIEAHWKNNVSLVVISVTVAGAVNAGWLIISLIAVFQHPTLFPLGVAFLGLQLVLGAAYVRMALKLSRDGEYAKHLGLESYFKTWSHRLYNGSMITSFAAPIFAIVLIAGYFFVGGDNATRWWESLRIATVAAVDTQAPSAATSVAAPKQNSAPPPSTGQAMKSCGGKQISASKVSADRAALNKASKGEYCTPGMTTYPCNCH